jgi:membrane-associated phospholipid phosphatase
MRSLSSTTFQRDSYNLNLTGLRRGLASLFTRPVRPLGTLAAALLVMTDASSTSADEVIHWNQIATDATTAAKTDPLTESRVFAIMHVAIHDALNSIEPRYEPYQLKKSAAPGASIEAAIAAAAHDTLVVVFPAAKSTFETAMEETLRTLPENLQRRAGLEIGQMSAKAILTARENDGANRTVQYTPGTEPGQYCPTPPDFTSAFFPHWGSITPFVLNSCAQFRPVEPPAVKSPRALADIAEVKVIGGINSVTRTAEQSEIARYWYENSPRGWNRIAREVAPAQHLNVWENARLFALVNLAMADGFVAGFECKYHYNYWRPVTAIRQSGDNEWLSYLWTPPVPDYPSTHMVLGAAAATVMARFFNTDLISFSMTSGEPNPGITRKFWSFSEAARENGASRILCGIHFRTAVEVGYAQGERVGEWVFEHALRPAKPGPATTPSLSLAEDVHK